MSFPGSIPETPDSWIERNDHDEPSGAWCSKCEHLAEDCRCPDPDEETGYPADWPKCAAGCGRPALDGHMTCGLAGCNEGGHRYGAL
jgi:hypothetical protein